MKRFFLVIAAIAAVLLVVAVAVPLLVPFDTYKPQIIEQVNRATGRELRIDGPIRLSVIPRLALELTKVGFSNAPGAEIKEMVTLDELRLVLELVPLLSGNIVVRSFLLDGPVIALEIDRKGTWNWMLGEPREDTKDEADVDSAVSVRDLRFDDVRIVGGTLTWLDRRTGARQRATDVNMKLRLPGLDQPFDADGELVWKGEKIAVDLTFARPRALVDGSRSALRAGIETATISVHAAGEMASTDPVRLDADIDLNVASIRKLAAWAGTPIQAAGSGLGPLRIRGKLAATGPKLAFEDAEIAIDDIAASGNVTLDSGGTRPRIEGKLEIASLDLNPYLPPEPAADAQPAAGGATPTWSDAPIDLEGLKALDANFAITAGELRIREIRTGKAVLEAKLKSGVLSLDLTELALYQGSGSGRITLDGSRAGSADMDVWMHLAQVQVEPLLRDAADFDRLAGTGMVDLSVRANGSSERELVQALHGKGSVDFREGTIRGIDLLEMVVHVASAFTGGNSNAKTEFSELGATFTIARGILTNNDAALRSAMLQVRGSGIVDLPKRTVDYRVTPKFVTPLVGEMGLGTPGVMVPVLIRGPWSNLSYQPDLVGLVEEGLQLPAKMMGEALDLGKLPGKLLGGQQAEPRGDEEKAQPEPSKPADLLRGLFGR